MTMAFIRETTPPRVVARRKVKPTLLIRAFAVFGTFFVAAAGAVAHFYAYEPSQIELAFLGFVGGVAGAMYAANFEGQSADDQRSGY